MQAGTYTSRRADWHNQTAGQIHIQTCRQAGILTVIQEHTGIHPYRVAGHTIHIHTHTHTLIIHTNTHIHTYIHTYIQTGMQSYIHTHIHTYT